MRKITKVLSMLLVLALMLSAVTMTASASVFPDVAAGSDYEQAIDLLASLKILGGYEDGTFKPENNITRAEFSKIVYVVFNGLVDAEGKMFASETNFDDVAANAWFAGHVNWAYLNKIVGGYGDGTFLPNNNVAVKEAVKMIVTCVTDKELSYPMGYIQEARAYGLLDDVLISDIDAPATRGQIAQMAANLLVTNSRLCLASTGRMDINGNEIYEKKPAITFVFGLNEIGGENSDHIAMLAGTYDDVFTIQGRAKLEEGQVAFWLYNKNADGKAGTLVANTPYVYDYEADINDLFGHYLTLYLTDKDELVAVVSRSTAISTTLNKMKANSGYISANVDGTTIALDAYEDVREQNETTRHYYFETIFTQESTGRWTETLQDRNQMRLSAITGTSARAQDNPITVIDADGNGEYDTFIKYYVANHKVVKYSFDAKTIELSAQPTDYVDQVTAIGNKTLYSADYVTGFEKFKELDFNDPYRPVYGNFYVTIKGDGQPYLTANVSEAVEGNLESIVSNGKSARVDGKSYTSYYFTSNNDSYGFFHNMRDMLGQTVRIYLDDCGYAQTMVLVDSTEDYGLNIVKVTAVTEEADRYGMNLAASMTVVDMDGNEKTYSLATEQNLEDSEYTFYTTVPSKWAASAANETYWAYDVTNKKYEIVDNYIQLEVDETTGVVKNIMTIEDLGTNGPTVANSTVSWSYEHLTDTLCYSEENGFYAGDKTTVTTAYGWPAIEFKGMYYGENDEGVIESAYYNAETIPEFYNQGEIIIIKADREIVAMLVIEKPDSYVDDKVLGIVTDWKSVAGESTIAGKASYRYAVDVWTNGETKTFYTEDFAANKLPTVEIDGDVNREGLAKDQLMYIQLLSDGKIKTKTSTNGNGTVLDIAYLMNTDLTFAYTDYNRSNFYSINKISKLTNTIPAGWTEDVNGRPVYNETATKGTLTTNGTASIRTCDETVYYTVNKVADVNNTATGIFQTVMAEDIKAGGSISVTDPDAGVYYVFAYTTLTEETAVDPENVGNMGTVFVFQNPVIANH
ncbi:MAG: S-layer homology domain-containing protein [Clostridia bacterium]|nr:S-layer homology domain-containing protein [Clostridia bacterium]